MTMTTRAKLFCLGDEHDTHFDNIEKFQTFWNHVEECEVIENTSKPSDFASEQVLIQQLKQYNEEAKRTSCKNLVIGITSHGEELKNDDDGKIEFKMKWKYKGKWEFLPVNKIFEIFDGNGKTNIFLLQMCRIRSDKETPAQRGVQHGTHVSKLASHQSSSGTVQSAATPSSSKENQGDSTTWPKTWKIAQPCIKDSIVLLSAPSGYYSHTDHFKENSGGWLLVAMNDVLDMVKGTEKSVLQLFLLVNQKMSEKKTVDGKEMGMSSFNHMLTENVILKFKEKD